MTGFVVDRPPRTDEELYWLVRALWGVTIPRHAVCPDHVAPFTAFADAYFARNSLDPDSEVKSLSLWHGSRGLSGKSFMLAVLGLTQAVLLGSDVNLLGGSFEQSKNIHTHMRSMWDYDNAPNYMLAADGTQEVRLTNKARIRPLTASQRTVRGPHPARLLLDEIDEMDLEILDAALGQPMPQPNYLGETVTPYTVMCSTWQNPEGTFTTVLRRAEERNIPIYRWCMHESANPIDGWLTPAAIEEKRQSISTEMWRVEYQLGEPSIGNRAFDTDAVDKSFSLPMEPVTKKLQKDFEEYTFAEPERDGVYVAGADWGKDQDYTVIAVARIDCMPRQLVYYMRVNRRPYPLMIDWFNQAVNRYSATAVHDKTMLGNVVNDLVDMRALGFTMNGAKRAHMLSDYVAAIEKGEWRFPRINTAYLAHKYARVGDLYSQAGSQGYHLPDEVCAFAFMQYAVHRIVRPAVPVVVRPNGEPTRLQKPFVPESRRQGDVWSGRETEDRFSLTV